MFSAVTSARQGEVFVSHVLDLDKGPGLAFLTPITDESNLVVVRIMLVEVNLDIVASIVALTANAMKGDRDEYLAAGMTDYLSKPVDRDALLDVLTKVARARR